MLQRFKWIFRKWIEIGKFVGYENGPVIL